MFKWPVYRCHKKVSAFDQQQNKRLLFNFKISCVLNEANPDLDFEMKIGEIR